MNRKQFLQKSMTAGVLLGAGGFPIQALAHSQYSKLTILHTNDQHSRVDPFPMDGSKLQGCGGFARRAAVIDQIRAVEEHVLLLDSGDIFQGTPYFNKYKGAVEIALMNQMRYDACTIGNHDFDGGMDVLSQRMREAHFPFLVANYNFDDTACNGRTAAYKCFQFGRVKVGVFGIGIELDGLVPATAYQQTRYHDPVSAANNTAAVLRSEEKCDFVICLSHLGYKYDEKKISDVVLAESTSGIDLILGGHTHTFFTEPKRYKNSTGGIVIINQVGWAGLVLGRIDFYFDKKRHHMQSEVLPIG
ncbi:MAG: metallophosphatase [Chitinophagales bacterium]